MIELVERNRTEIEELCRRFNVVRLEVFGSAVDGDFDPSRSDVDFLIEFAPNQDLGPWLAHYLDFKAELETLLGRKVDLVMPKAIRNRYFLREMNRTRTPLYAA
jgi:hypothetical protein